METTVAKIPFSELGLALGQQFLTREVIGGSGVAVLIGVGLGLWLTPVLQSPPAAAEPSELQINAPVTQPLEMADAVAPIQTVQQPELSPQLASVDSPAPARADDLAVLQPAVQGDIVPAPLEPPPATRGPSVDIGSAGGAVPPDPQDGPA